MVMTTYLGAGYSTWKADTAYSVLDNSRAIIQECLGDLAGYRDIMPTNMFTKFDQTRRKLFDSESGNPNFGQFKSHNSGVHGGFCWL